jgi:hypothetical protein
MKGLFEVYISKALKIIAERMEYRNWGIDY